ncbi:hypothetical protein FB451DRAFT_1191906 [Mycena latifolia]|nr:hypothetical protein FB451DRAFT_1191906 [Mycena latifolia]
MEFVWGWNLVEMTFNKEAFQAFIILDLITDDKCMQRSHFAGQHVPCMPECCALLKIGRVLNVGIKQQLPPCHKQEAQQAREIGSFVSSTPQENPSVPQAKPWPHAKTWQSQAYLQQDGSSQKGQQKIKTLTYAETFTPNRFLDNFLGPVKKDVAVVNQIIQNKILLVSAPPLESSQEELVSPGQMPKYILPQTVENPGVCASLKKLGPPPILLICFSDLLSPRVQQPLWDAFQQIVNAKPYYPQTEHGHSATPAWHFGIWSLFENLPEVTADSSIPIQAAQSWLVGLINNFLLLVKFYLVPKARVLLRCYIPTVM